MTSLAIEPAYPAFQAAYDAGKPQLVWCHLVSDLETPVSAWLKLGSDQPNAFLLESVEGGAIRGRYSFIGLSPDLIWRCHGDRAEVNREALDDAFSRFEHFERRMDNLESQLEVMDMGKDVAPSLAAEISALEEDEKISAELERLKAEVGAGEEKRD